MKKIVTEERSELGATMIDYALMASLIAIVAIGALTALGKETMCTNYLNSLYLIDDVCTGSGNVKVGNLYNQLAADGHDNCANEVEAFWEARCLP